MTNEIKKYTALYRQMLIEMLAQHKTSNQCWFNVELSSQKYYAKIGSMSHACWVHFSI